MNAITSHSKRFYRRSFTEIHKTELYLKMILQFIVSQKDDKLLIHNGYLHTSYKEGVNKFILCCSEYKTCKFTSNYTTTRGEIGIIIIIFLIFKTRIYMQIYVLLRFT